MFLLQFQLNEAQVGLAFLGEVVMYTLSAPVVGRLCDKLVSFLSCMQTKKSNGNATE